MTPTTLHRRRPARLVTAFAAALATLAAAFAAAVVTAAPASAATICEQYGTVVAGNYVIQNNRWGTTATQCINTTSSGFSITQQDGVGSTSGAPVSYPSIFLGCHYSNCSPGSPLPKQISTIGTAPSSISYTYPGSGTYNASYDIWLNADTNVSGVQDTEIMIWFNKQGSIQPIGSRTGSTSIAGRTWEVWTGNNGGNNVVSYISGSPIGSLSFDVMDFVDDTLTRGSQYGNASWYLTSVQAGFEPWIGGVGLTVNSFSASVTSGGGGNPSPTPTSPPVTPTSVAVTGTTTSSVSLSWASALHATSYQVERAVNNSVTFTRVGTPSGTTFTDSGLTAGTQYFYRVRAVNNVGTSPYSTVVSATTGSDGGGGGGGGGTTVCTTTIAAGSTWTGGYTVNVTVKNTSTMTVLAWRSSVTLPSGHSHVNSWPGTSTVSGQTVTQASQSWNATLAPGQSVTWGMQASRPSSATSLPTSGSCVVAVP
ncbi:GH12 family glycosyl hydrolase domain-containing protein [Antribacter gilvus]|uniref:GH12 family glycosyl hydrolase domain-containing protein n=1 Tax=Antribacter gilvus TaxID=2304675 RepID=UPI000F781930|nr:cellulose binding domain-containing protein [Antribacter gilvus]